MRLFFLWVGVFYFQVAWSQTEWVWPQQGIAFTAPDDLSLVLMNRQVLEAQGTTCTLSIRPLETADNQLTIIQILQQQTTRKYKGPVSVTLSDYQSQYVLFKEKGSKQCIMKQILQVGNTEERFLLTYTFPKKQKKQVQKMASSFYAID